LRADPAVALPERRCSERGFGDAVLRVAEPGVRLRVDRRPPDRRSRVLPLGTMKRRGVLSAALSLALLALGAGRARAQGSPCTFSASPSGSGNGKTADKPSRVDRFWRSADPGETLCLLDGRYTEADSMLAPPSGFKGTGDKPVTVRAVNEGKVLFDGQG